MSHRLYSMVISFLATVKVAFCLQWDRYLSLSVPHLSRARTALNELSAVGGTDGQMIFSNTFIYFKFTTTYVFLLKLKKLNSFVAKTSVHLSHGAESKTNSLFIWDR